MLDSTVDLKISRWSWPNNICTFRTKGFLWLILGQEVKDLELKEDLTLHCWFRDREVTWQEAEGSPKQTSSKDTGTSFTEPQGTESFQQEWAWKWNLPPDTLDWNSAGTTSWFQPHDTPSNGPTSTWLLTYIPVR